MECKCKTFVYVIYCSLAVSVTGFTILADAGPATERTTDLIFRCDVTELAPDDELLKVTWFYYDQQLQNFVEIFSADLTSDVPAYFFADTWSGRAIYEPSGVGNIILPAKFVTKEFIGEYRCKVNSLLSSAVANLKVDVFYGPGTSIVTTPGGRVERREGDSFTLTCTAQCNPLCAYRWYKAGKKVSDEAVLEMTSLAYTDAGLYACQARNDAGRSIKPVDLRIFYRASIISFNISGLIQDSETGIQTLVDSNIAVVANCEVNGWPESSVDWFKDGSSIWKVNSTVVTQLNLDKKHSSYEFKPATCLDNGEYTCQATNGIDNPVQKTAVLNLGCPPFETNQSTKCQPGSEIDTVINMNEFVDFYLCFYGYPDPTVTVTTDEGDAADEHVYNLNVKCHRTEKHCEAELQLNITKPQQYGRYQAKISNSQGFLYKKYNILSRQPPTLPSYFRVENSTQSSVCLTWDAQFNGGLKQTYSLSYRPKNRPAATQSDEDSYEVYMVEEDESSADTLKSYTTCINNLIPSCEYEVILTTSNIYGRSKQSKNISFTTVSSGLDLGDGPVKSWLQRLNSDSKISVHGEEFPGDEILNSGGDNAELIVKPATPKRHQSFPFKESTTKSSANTKHQHKGPRGQNKVNGDNDHDNEEEDEDSFFQLFDSFFALDALTDPNSSVKPRAFANFSAHIRKLVNSYARVHQNGSRHSSLNRLSLPTNPVSKHDVELTTSAVSTSAMDDSTEKKSLVISLIVSTSSVTILFVLGTVITLTCLSVTKKRRRLKDCKKRHLKRMKLCRGVGGMEVVVAAPHVNPAEQSTDTAPGPDTSSQKTHLVNDVLTSATLRSSASLRPRLATPDINSSRQKLTSSSSLTNDEKSDCLLPENDVIPRETMRASYPSYLDLYASGGNSGFTDEINIVEGITSHACTDMLSLSRLDTITPPDSRYSSDASIHQTGVKMPSNADAEESTKYLDLYETLAIRSRSRSPSNIYDPLHFDLVHVETVTCSSPKLSHHKTKQKDYTKVKEVIRHRLLRHARMTKPSNEHELSPKCFSNHVRSVVKSWERSLMTPHPVDTPTSNSDASLSATSNNWTLLPSDPNSRKSISDGYLKPRDFSYANTNPVTKSYSLNSSVHLSTSPVSKSITYQYANMGNPTKDSQSFDEVYSVDRLMIMNGASSNESMSYYEEGVMFSKDSHYADIDTCFHCRPYIDMKSKSLSPRQDNKNTSTPSVASEGHFLKQKSQIFNLKYEDSIRPVSAEYLTPFTQMKRKSTIYKQTTFDSGTALSLADSHDNTSVVQSVNSNPVPLQSDSDTLKTRNDVRAYMVTDCVNIHFPEDNCVFGPRNESQPDIFNIYDEVITPVLK